MSDNNTCAVCGGHLETVIIEGMAQTKCVHCGYIEVPRWLLNNEAAARSQKFRFLTTANALYAEILNKIATPQTIRWPERLLGEDVNTFLGTPIYGMLYAAWLTKGFRSTMTSEIKAVIQAVYEPAVALKKSSVVLAVLINLYENSLRKESRNEEKKHRNKILFLILAAVAVVAALVVALVLLDSHAPTLSDSEIGAVIRLPKDSVPMFQKLGAVSAIKPLQSTSVRYVDTKRILKNRTETFSVYEIAIEKGGDEIDLKAAISVALPIPDGYDTTCLAVYLINRQDKTYSKVDSILSLEDNTVTFPVESFGTYAIAEVEPVVTFDTSDVFEIESDVVKRDTLLDEPVLPDREGYVFEGWTYNGEKWNFGKDRVLEDMTLVAAWTPIEYYISYRSNGGNYCDDGVYTVEDEVALTTPTRPGYRFLGWYESSELTGKGYTSLPVGSTGDKTFYAKWVLMEYVISYQTEVGSGHGDITYTVESDQIVLPTMTCTGYNFLGWYENSAYTGMMYTEVPAGSTGNKTFYAKWEMIEYQISYQPNGGSHCDDRGYTVKDLVTLPNPTRPGYDFVGWYDNSSLTGKNYSALPAGTIGNKIFYAKWSYKTVAYLSDYKEITIDASYVKARDTFYLDDLSVFLNSDYILTFKIEVYMRETFSGYQEIYLADDEQSYVWSKTNYEYGGGGKANTTFSWVTFTCSATGDKCTSTMHIMYGANGDYSDDWVRARTRVTVTVSKR